MHAESNYPRMGETGETEVDPSCPVAMDLAAQLTPSVHLTFSPESLQLPGAGAEPRAEPRVEPRAPPEAGAVCPLSTL